MLVSYRPPVVSEQIVAVDLGGADVF